MKLLVHNFLASKFLKNVVTGYPLKLSATEVNVLPAQGHEKEEEEVESQHDDGHGAEEQDQEADEFVKRMMPKIDYKVLKKAADDVGHGQCLPEELKNEWENDSDLLKNLHKVLLRVEVVEGYLECPETGRRFPIKNGIPNMLANEDEVA